jgi:hypothetical protein
MCVSPEKHFTTKSAKPFQKTAIETASSLFAPWWLPGEHRSALTRQLQINPSASG